MGTLVAAAGTGLLIRHNGLGQTGAPPVKGARVLQMKEALLVAGALTLIAALVRAASHWLGPEAVVASASLSAVVDAHASAAALGGLYSSGDIGIATAKIGVVAVITANSLSRAVVAASAGGRAFALPVAANLVVSAAASWVGWWFSRASESPAGLSGIRWRSHLVATHFSPACTGAPPCRVRVAASGRG
jgi:uncharacterized membrane protein (DUF4010 family)